MAPCSRGAVHREPVIKMAGGRPRYANGRSHSIQWSKLAMTADKKGKEQNAKSHEPSVRRDRADQCSWPHATWRTGAYIRQSFVYKHKTRMLASSSWHNTGAARWLVVRIQLAPTRAVHTAWLGNAFSRVGSAKSLLGKLAQCLALHTAYIRPKYSRVS